VTLSPSQQPKSSRGQFMRVLGGCATMDELCLSNALFCFYSALRLQAFQPLSYQYNITIKRREHLLFPWEFFQLFCKISWFMCRKWPCAQDTLKCVLPVTSVKMSYLLDVVFNFLSVVLSAITWEIIKYYIRSFLLIIG
jgi:hypothetical protein